MISDFIKKISPQVGLEPTKMRHDLKKSVSVLPEGEEKILSFISDFKYVSTLVYYVSNHWTAAAVCMSICQLMSSLFSPRFTSNTI